MDLSSLGDVPICGVSIVLSDCHGEEQRADHRTENKDGLHHGVVLSVGGIMSVPEHAVASNPVGRRPRELSI